MAEVVKQAVRYPAREMDARRAGDSARVLALKNLQQQAYDLLVARILRLEPGFEPGSRLDVPALAQELGVSLTPVKDSLRLLQAHGLIEMSTRRGTFVASLSGEQLDQYIDVLRELEIAALRLAPVPLDPSTLAQLRQQIGDADHAISARREVEEYYANQGFHETLVALSGNRELLNLYSAPRAYRLVIAYRSSDPELERRLLGQHAAIAEALESNAREAAHERIHEHWETCRALGHAAIEHFERRTRT